MLVHIALSDRKYQRPNCANMAYTFERDGTFWCKLWIHTIVDTDLEVAHFYYSSFLFSLDNNLNIFVK